jgi:lipopolysaccharide export system ATP-binding protein
MSALRDHLGRLAAGDRSLLHALRAVILAADEQGTFALNDAAVRYRDAYLAQWRTEGRDADRESGRLSLDEVRAHLVSSVLPRLVAEGAVRGDLGALAAPDARLAVSDALWAEVREARAEFCDGIARDTAEHAAPAPAPATVAVPGGSRLEARGLVKVYRKRRVVNDVSVTLAQGEIVGLLGPNGAGKTTSFYMIVGLIPPVSGQILLDGQDITATPMFKRARLGLGYLSQEPSIFRKLTVEENIMAILETLPIGAAERTQRLERLLDELSIKHLRKSKAYALSGGERRRLEITRALVTEPKFMMLDEPFAGVDPIAVHDIQQIVAGLRHRGIGVLISDHNVEQTLDIVDRAYIMFDGRVTFAGTVRELVFDERAAELYLGPTLAGRLRARYGDAGPDLAAAGREPAPVAPAPLATEGAAS